MAAIYNALFGSKSDSNQQNQATDETTVENSSGNSIERLQTSATAGDVQIKSSISSKTQSNMSLNDTDNMDKLLSELGSTHEQVDQYARTKTSEINEQVRRSISDVLDKTKHQQQDLLVDANSLHLDIDNNYRRDLQNALELLDGVRAKALADLEHKLQMRQQTIMAAAKREIDRLNEQANTAKLRALAEAQEQVSKNVDKLTDQMTASNQLDTDSLLQSTTTTIITTQSEAIASDQTDASLDRINLDTQAVSKKETRQRSKPDSSETRIDSF